MVGQCKRNLEIYSGIIVLVRISPSARAGHTQQLDVGKRLAQQGHCLVGLAALLHNLTYALDGSGVTLCPGWVCRYPGFQLGFLLLLAPDDIELRE